MMKRLLGHKRGGYTLLELTFSIALYTAIVLMCLIGFIGIFGIYNKAQSLTRTQEEARKAMDALTRDLRQTIRVTKPATVVSYGARPVLALHCLDTGGQNVGYGLGYIASQNHYVLVRSTNCTDFSQAALVTSPDVWSEKLAPNLWPDTSTDDGVAPDTAPFKISQVATTGGIGPVVWQVRIGVFRGATAPSKNPTAAVTDQFGAGTMLQSVVISRND